jgi:4-hydroxybenzoate polyprenyltransferase
MPFSLDATTLFLGLITGGIGMVLFVYGKKQERWPHLIAGLLYMLYPYFVGSAIGIIGVGVALGVGLWYAVRQGY